MRCKSRALSIRLHICPSGEAGISRAIHVQHLRAFTLRVKLEEFICFLDSPWAFYCILPATICSNPFVPSENTEQRKLAAIMFTDMVGYSALSQRNEALALELLAENQRLLRMQFPLFNGREVKTTGDGFLVEFPSALQATQCAVGNSTRNPSPVVLTSRPLNSGNCMRSRR